jgi:hypothetical protein
MPPRDETNTFFHFREKRKLSKNEQVFAKFRLARIFVSGKVIEKILGFFQKFSRKIFVYAKIFVFGKVVEKNFIFAKDFARTKIFV